MNRPLAVAVLLAAAYTTSAGAAFGCPCQGSAGAGAAVTSTAQTYGASLTTTGRLVHGAWTPDGQYSALGPNSHQWMVDVGLSVGYRPIERIELGAESAFGRQSVEAPGLSSAQSAFGDTSVRVRWDAVDEPMPYEDDVLPPAVALALGLRMPTGYVGSQAAGSASGTTGSIGSSASGQGLGAWEPNATLDLWRSIRRRFRVGLSGEVGYRFPDSALGIDRQLGPRLLGRLNLRWMPSVKWGLGVINDLGWEGPVALEGVTRIGSAQRVWGVAAYGYYVLADAGLRLGAMVRYAPPVDGVSVNAVSASSLALSVGYAH